MNLTRVVLPGATLAAALALTAIVAKCGRAAPGYVETPRSRALYAVAYCDAELANMRGQSAKAQPELAHLLATDLDAARIYLEQHVATIFTTPRSGCESARVLVQEAFAAGDDDMRMREDGGRLMLHAPRIEEAERAYLALHGALERKETAQLRPLADALARALR